MAARVPGRRPARLKRRGLDPEERELRRLQAKICDMTMRLELAEHLLEKGGSRRRVSVGLRCPYTDSIHWPSGASETAGKAAVFHACDGRDGWVTPGK